MTDCTRRRFLEQGLLALPVLASAPAVLGAAAPAAKLSVDFSKSGLSVMKRDRWASASPDPRRLRRAYGYDKITVHHSGATRNYHTVENAVIHDIECICAGHRSRRYGDIGYHFILDYAGRVWEGRGLPYQGAHVLGRNVGNIGIMLLGNFDDQSPSAKQLASLKKLVSALCASLSITPARVYGHRDIGASSCPGRNLYPHIPRLRSQPAQTEIRTLSISLP
jgi:hypothetical protein